MKILLINNFYQQPGGENSWFPKEKNLLKRFGHEVITYTRHNHEIRDFSLPEKLSLPIQAVWAKDSYEAISTIIRREKPEIAHFTNTFPLISPAAYYACQRNGVPVVQSLHNYRLMCPAATFYRNGRVCESCLSHQFPWPAIWHKCYRHSRAQTAVVSTMLTFHNIRQTWASQVNHFIALTQFSKQKFIQGGISPNQISVKPNFLEADPGFVSREGTFALFVGRLVPEKGLLTLLQAWSRINFPLKIVGDGPLLPHLQDFLETNPHTIEYLGQLTKEQVIVLMFQARLLIIPSEWYEGLPMTLVEAFACGLPVLASRLGSLEELIQNGETGLHFTAGDRGDLTHQIQYALKNPNALATISKQARAVFEKHYTAEQNYQLLMEIYAQAQTSLYPGG